MMSRGRAGGSGRRRVLAASALLTGAVVGLAACGTSAPGPAVGSASGATPVSTAAAAASGVPSASARPPAPRAGTVDRSLTVGGLERTYRVHVPAAATRAAAGGAVLPVVVVLHGGGGSGRQVEQQSGMSAEADRAGFLAVYPDGTGRLRTSLLTWNAGTCCGYAHQNNIDDVAFLSALLDRLGREYPVDTRRIYVTGMSNGGMMSYRIGCEHAGRVAAIAAVSGALDTVTCTPSRAVPVIAFHGTADVRVRYDGGESSLDSLRKGEEKVDRSVAEAMTFWTRRDGCPATPTRTQQGDVRHDVYGPCSSGAAVELYSIVGAGHAWPGGTQTRAEADAVPPSPHASAVMWEFFRHHPLPA
ncbi:Poly(3-hydroxybutyrate) depolymerase [Frankia canadensis]|uniref:Poly(3-hydroxybutyrate) depolymerase n=1 Tax=Frankia canadensis TaxID=1836972 RepID=A0A2I2KK58_9ACTN|nr:PHB depolymerase family esterase [Frankia canadensis]SNQ46050.1 Poly(3-hydroxybutyrate) depolymerase [Frankia canadensis]SOU53340.1 Poly(3-hydroxybutyrate) depolymerase [Frankia canadensis]